LSLRLRGYLKFRFLSDEEIFCSDLDLHPSRFMSDRFATTKLVQPSLRIFPTFGARMRWLLGKPEPTRGRA
jgi:hypothetical protein